MINLANDGANVILSNSAVNLRLRIVGIESAESGFVEPVSTTTANAFSALLGYLTTPNDGKLELTIPYHPKL